MTPDDAVTVWPDPATVAACADASARRTRRDNLHYLLHAEGVTPETRAVAARAWMDEGWGV